MIRVEVKLFARARDLAGPGPLAVELPDGATVASLRSALASRWPALGAFLPRCAVAVNGEFTQEGQALADGDEAAILPPVSGG
jgi:molybdopterin converting factor subunit 1